MAHTDTNGLIRFCVSISARDFYVNMSRNEDNISNETQGEIICKQPNAPVLEYVNLR